jgi:hypothetical protein
MNRQNDSQKQRWGEGNRRLSADYSPEKSNNTGEGKAGSYY